MKLNIRFRLQTLIGERSSILNANIETLERMSNMIVPSECNAAVKGDIAKAVLMPGDPLRAKFVAEKYFEDSVCFNTIRNMLGYTGRYKGKLLSVMGSGMGIPSMGLYAYELYNFFDVDSIIRIGSAGGIGDDVQLRDVVIAIGASTNSSYADQYRFPGTLSATASYALLRDAVEISEKNGNNKIKYILTKRRKDLWLKLGNVAVETNWALF